MDFPDKMLVVLEFVPPKVFVFLELAWGNGLNQSDNTSGEIQFAG